MKFFAFLLISAIGLHARDLDTGWTMSVDKTSEFEALLFTRPNEAKPFGLWRAPSRDIFFIDQRIIRLSGYPHELAVTRWTHGAHSETVRVFDPLLKSGALLFEETSEWGISVEPQEDKVVIRLLTDTSSSEPWPEEKTIEWKPPRR